MELELNQAQLAHTHHLDSKTIDFVHRGGGLGQGDTCASLARDAGRSQKSGHPVFGGVVRSLATGCVFHTHAVFEVDHGGTSVDAHQSRDVSSTLRFCRGANGRWRAFLSLARWACCPSRAPVLLEHDLH